MNNLYVTVALQIPLFNTYQYAWQFESKPLIGSRVWVPFGGQKKVGIILSIENESQFDPKKIKAVDTIIDTEPVIDELTYKLLTFASKYYVYPIGEVFFHALPIKLREGHSTTLQAETEYHWCVTSENFESENLKRSPKQKQLYEIISSTPASTEVLKNLGFTQSVITALKEKQLISQIAQSIAIQPFDDWQSNYDGAINPLVLNREQATTVSMIHSLINDFNTWLIEGITGSGKTEVYLHLIDEVLKLGKQVLVLIPEIGLTPQTISRFQARFNVPMTVLHSKLNDKARLKAWVQAKKGDVAIVIGTRSAVFTPFKSLGLIIIDEEHDSSYKQQEGFRYHARDIAITRAKPINVPVILGTATPSLESLHNAKSGRFRYLKLIQRAGNAILPKQHIIDLKNQPLESGLSHPLLHAMRTHLSANNQVLLFLNRRGYAPALLCHECGWIAECQQCDKYYTLHQAIYKLRCHHCDHQIKAPVQCKNCGSTQLMGAGIGTEQLEEKLATLFPSVPISRIDRDTVSRKGKLEDELELIYQGGRRIIVGTQMLAKGHHFSDVTLVALLDVDGALFSADFRAAEHFGQLYTQVSGRAGRASKPGVVYLQTHHPDHPWLNLLFNEGYAGLADLLLKEREMTMLPPFAYHACLRAEGVDSQFINQFLISTRNQLRSSPHYDNSLWVLGPVPALMAKRSGRYRWQLLLQHPNRHELHKQLSLLKAIIFSFPKLSRIKWSLDVDPLET